MKDKPQLSLDSISKSRNSINGAVALSPRWTEDAALKQTMKNMCNPMMQHSSVQDVVLASRPRPRPVSMTIKEQILEKRRSHNEVSAACLNDGGNAFTSLIYQDNNNIPEKNVLALTEKLNNGSGNNEMAVSPYHIARTRRTQRPCSFLDLGHQNYAESPKVPQRFSLIQYREQNVPVEMDASSRQKQQAKNKDDALLSKSKTSLFKASSVASNGSMRSLTTESSPTTMVKGPQSGPIGGSSQKQSQGCNTLFSTSMRNFSSSESSQMEYRSPKKSDHKKSFFKNLFVNKKG